MGINTVRLRDDFARVYNWDVFVTLVPGGGDPQRFTFQARSSVIPDTGTEGITVPYKRQDFKLPGREVTAHTIELTVNVDSEWKIYKDIINWKNLSGDGWSGLQAPSLTFKSTMRMVMTNGMNEPTFTVILEGVYPETIPTVTIDYATSDIVQLPVTFSYDLVKYEGVSPLS